MLTQRQVANQSAAYLRATKFSSHDQPIVHSYKTNRRSSYVVLGIAHARCSVSGRSLAAPSDSHGHVFDRLELFSLLDDAVKFAKIAKMNPHQPSD